MLVHSAVPFMLLRMILGTDPYYWMLHRIWRQIEMDLVGHLLSLSLSLSHVFILSIFANQPFTTDLTHFSNRSLVPSTGPSISSKCQKMEAQVPPTRLVHDSEPGKES